MSRWEMPKNLIAYRTEELVGRGAEKDKICDAIQEGSHLVYLEGAGGIGKTRLLEEISEFVVDLVPIPLVLGIIDFYDTAMHGSLSVEQELVDQLQKLGIAGKHFDPFLQALANYRVSEIDDENEVHTAFIQSFNSWVGKRQVILRFDTGEALEYGQDAPEVLVECEVHGAEAPAFQWLRERLGCLEQTTAIIAARPTRKLCGQLKSAYEDGNWLLFQLDTLSLGETRRYFEISPYGEQIDEEMVERIWLLSDGRPILLSLAIDWLIRGMKVNEIYDIDLADLREKRESGGAAWEIILRRFERALVQGFRRLETPLDAAIYYTARARKGFTTDMLRRMLRDLCPQHIELSPVEARRLIEEMRQLSFVKHPHGAREGWFFLHDEMYDLVDRYVWRLDYPTYTHQVETARFLAEEIYGEKAEDGLIAEAVKSLQDAKTYPEMRRARRHLDELRTEQLFYWLEADPLDGYQRYRRLDIQAISQRNHEWDDMLRIETQRFLHTFTDRAIDGGIIQGRDDKGRPMIADFVNQDRRALWLYRFFARGEIEKTLRIAEKILRLHPKGGELWKARILVIQGAAQQRLDNPNTEITLKQSLEVIEGIQGGEAVADLWHLQNTQGLAYLYLGLHAKWSWVKADEYYKKAGSIFEKNQELAQVARINTNRAYALVQQKKYAQAVQVAREAVNQRRELGDLVGLALSLNVQSIAEVKIGSPARAKQLAKRALRLLQSVRSTGYPEMTRETALIYVNLGNIIRYQIRQGDILRSPEIIDRYFEEALGALLEAEKRYQHLTRYYKFKLYNRLGKLYKDWANRIANQQMVNKGRVAKPTRERYSEYMSQANKYLEKANEIAIEAEFIFQVANNLEDWAWIYHLRLAFRENMQDKASPKYLREKELRYLDRAEKLLQLGSNDHADKYFLEGNICHQRGRYFHKFEEDYVKAIQQYALAIGYYDRFSEVQPIRRREIVMEHIEDILNKRELNSAQKENLIEVMQNILDERSLRAEQLRELLREQEAVLKEGEL
ncbi:MAG TPA: ATP-binding protein [Thermoflexia bacterium]|nr:ATP-binding protein [Thermoflexia bacterium]